jgi:hypothetical protein
MSNRKELLRMIRALSDRGVNSCMSWVSMVYKDEQGKAAIAELAALKAAGVKPTAQRKRPVKLPANVVTFPAKEPAA